MIGWLPAIRIVRNALGAQRFGTVWHKLLARARGEHRRRAEATRWSAAAALGQDALARLDGPLWEEAVWFCAELERRAEEQLRTCGFGVVGSGAHCVLLYFVARWIRPASVLETGVAAGYSSAALLAALERNDAGHLYSSDFPYLRVADPERHIGCLVPGALRHRWTLEIEGDRSNVPRLLARAGPIELFHYDSDKSYTGRRWVFARVEPRLARDAVVVMDDIQDNFFFRDWVTATQLPFVVLSFRGKYVGVASRRFSHPGMSRLATAVEQLV